MTGIFDMDEMIDLRRLVDRLAIADLLGCYSRAIDRCDRSALLGIWADGATLDYGSGVMDAREWSRGVIDRMRAMNRTMHALSNMQIDIDGDEAKAETYCTAYHHFDSDGGARRMIVGGRYLDWIARKDGQWRIVHRIYVMDWNENDPSSALWGEGPYTRLGNIGGRWPDDLLYSL